MLNTILAGAAGWALMAVIGVAIGAIVADKHDGEHAWWNRS
jgi:hypothetical protein